MNKLDQVVKDNTNKNKNKNNDAIEYDPGFDSRFSLSSRTKDPISVVPIRLRGDKKQRATIIYGLTVLWDSGANNSMIKRR